MPTTTKYIWDDDNYLAEADGSDTINVVYTSEPQQYGSLVSTRISNTTSYHHFDALGSTRQLTCLARHVTDAMSYESWGGQIARSGTSQIQRLWAGRIGYYTDQETSLVWVQQRPLSTAFARWTTVDPLEFHDATNRYLYVLNSPIDLLDPSGFATLIKSPGDNKSVDWCKVGQKAGLRSDDPDGLPIGVWGQTVAIAYDVNCVCNCCDELCRKYELSCTVRCFLKVKISPGNFQGERGVTFEGVYGHEMVHVQGLIDFAVSVQNAASTLEKSLGCTTRGQCGARALAANLGFNIMMGVMFANQQKHLLGMGPKQMVALGAGMKIPGDPNCAAPGPVPDFPSAKECPILVT